MTIRERIADWISGGALTRARRAQRLFLDDSKTAMTMLNKLARNSSGRIEALRKIAAQRTPKANATVNRMADIAEEALRDE